jgi:hypothetical protein
MLGAPTGPAVVLATVDIQFVGPLPFSSGFVASLWRKPI